MIRHHSITLFFCLAIVLPLASFLVLSWYQHGFEQLPVLLENREAAVFDMKNEQGRRVTQDDWAGKVVVVNFFFTHCPVVCPKMTANLARVQRELAGDGRLRIASFSVDPERDSVAALAAYGRRFGVGTGWDLLTGDKRAIYRLARKTFGVVATDGDGGPSDFIHSDQLILLDGQRRIRGFYEGTGDMNGLLRDIRRLEKEND